MGNCNTSNPFYLMKRFDNATATSTNRIIILFTYSIENDVAFGYTNLPLHGHTANWVSLLNVPSVYQNSHHISIARSYQDIFIQLQFGLDKGHLDMVRIVMY